MRRHVVSRMLCCAALGLGGLFAQAQAATVDFESLPASLFFSGDSFSENGFKLGVSGDFGIVDTAAAFFIAQAPTGNDTQFYAGLNDSLLVLTSAGGLPFRLSGFDAAFIAPEPQGPGVLAGRIFASGVDSFGNAVFGSWEFAPSADDGSFAFLNYNAGFSAFGSLQSVSFGACVYTDTGGCEHPYQNLGQFALDNVNVAVVPEPSTYALLAFGLTALALRQKRRGAR
jgi:hypothetical protein